MFYHAMMSLLMASMFLFSCSKIDKQPSERPPEIAVKPGVTVADDQKPASARPEKQLACEREELLKIGSVPVWRVKDEPNIIFSSGMAIDADGSPRAYHPDNKGLDDLANAGKPGQWWAIVTENGNPVIQKEGDPYPGYYISMTTLEDKTKSIRDTRRYVDSEKIPYFVLPPQVRDQGKVSIGDLGVVYNSRNGKWSYAIFADVGPGGKIGEGSIALAEALGINSNPRKGGTDRGVVYLIFPGSGNQNPKTLEDIKGITEALFSTWGGIERLKLCQ